MGEGAAPAGGLGSGMTSIPDNSANDNTATGSGVRVAGHAFSPNPFGESFGSDGAYTAPDAPEYDFAEESFSISFWAKGAFGEFDILANKRVGGRPFWQAEPTPGGGFTWNIRDAAGNNAEFNIGGALDNNWHHFVLLRNADTNEIRGYRDGVFAGSAAEGHVGSIATDTPLGIGAGSNGSDPYNGQVDDFRIYNVALTAADAAAIYNNGDGDLVIIPEPGTLTLAALGLLSLGLARWRRRRGK